MSRSRSDRCTGAVRLFIGEPLALGALHSNGGSLRIVDAEPKAVGIPKVELGQVAVQVLLAAVLVHAFHAALEDREVYPSGQGRLARAR
jgi:hypothetical protein